MRAIEEHGQLLEHLARRDCQAAQHLMEHHILSALEDIVRFGLQAAGDAAEPGQRGARPPVS